MRTADVITSTGLSHTAANETPDVLAAWNMISRDPQKSWTIVATTSLSELAEHFGVLEAVAQQIHTYRQDRIIWREWLTKRALALRELLSPTEDYPSREFEGPPNEWTLPQLVLTQAG